MGLLKILGKLGLATIGLVLTMFSLLCFCFFLLSLLNLSLGTIVSGKVQALYDSVFIGYPNGVGYFIPGIVTALCGVALSNYLKQGTDNVKKN
jgi:hypothetical protein